MTDAERAGDLSTSPISPDRCAEFADLNARNTSPFAPQGFSLEDSRAQFPFTAGTDGSGNEYRDYSFMAPLRCSPLTTKGDQSGMAYINTAGVQINFNNLNNSIWSHDLTAPGATWTGVTVTMPIMPRLHIEYVTLGEDSDPFPMVQELPYERTDINKSVVGTVASGTTADLISGSFNASVVPSTLHAYAKRTTDVTTNTSAVLGVQSATLTFGNTPGLLSTKLPRDLYLMSRDAGNQQTYIDWSQRQGSVLSVPVASALGLGSMSPGETVGAYTLGITLGVKSQFAGDFIPQIVMVAVTPGVVRISQDDISLSTGIFTSEGRDIAIEHGEDVSAIEGATDEVGGSLFGKVGSFVSRHTKNLAKTVREISKVGTPLVGAFAPELLPEFTGATALARSLSHPSQHIHKMAAANMLAQQGGGSVGGALIGGGPGSVRMQRIAGRR